MPWQKGEELEHTRKVRKIRLGYKRKAHILLNSSRLTELIALRRIAVASTRALHERQLELVGAKRGINVHWTIDSQGRDLDRDPRARSRR